MKLLCSYLSLTFWAPRTLSSCKIVPVRFTWKLCGISINVENVDSFLSMFHRVFQCPTGPLITGQLTFSAPVDDKGSVSSLHLPKFLTSTAFASLLLVAMQPVAKEAVSVATECKDDEGSCKRSDAESEVNVQMDVACSIAFCRAVLLDQRQVCDNSNTDDYFFSFIHRCVRRCGMQMYHVSLSFQLFYLSVRIVSSQSSLSDHRPMFVLVSLFLVCLPVFLLLFSADCHIALMFFSACGPHKTYFCFLVCLS